MRNLDTNINTIQHFIRTVQNVYVHFPVQFIQIRISEIL